MALISCVPVVHAVAFHSLVLMPFKAKRLTLRNLCASSKAESHERVVVVVVVVMKYVTV